MTQKKNTLTKTGIVALLACVCCILWGSAIPVIKTGYRLMQVDSADTESQIVFAGVRFTLAGILVLIFVSIKERKVMIPDREILKYAVPVCLAQTVGQYFLVLHIHQESRALLLPDLETLLQFFCPVWLFGVNG